MTIFRPRDSNRRHVATLRAMWLMIPILGFVGALNAQSENGVAALSVRDESTSSTLPTGSEATRNASSGGAAIARLYIPRLGSRVWGVPIYPGTSEIELARGVGHFPQSARPQNEGNFALFGHRTTHLKPFYLINALKAGDEVFVETSDRWYVYTLRTSKIVRPSDVWVATNTRYWALKVPRDESYRVITLITCEPPFSVDKRWVWWGELSGVFPVGSLPPTLHTTPTGPAFVHRLQFLMTRV